MLLAYSLTLLLVLLYFRVYLLPDQMIFFGMVGAFFIGRSRKFIKDWFPMVLLLFAYEAMRGIVYSIGPLIHFIEPIIAEEALFGGIPTIILQELFFSSGTINWWDLVAGFAYSLHFVVPLFFAYFLWIKNEELYKRFAINLVVVSYAALITFLIFPVAPPWMASQQGYIGEVKQILFEIQEVYPMLFFKTLYVFVNSNPVAAIPSLHSAYPFMIFLFSLKHFGWKAFTVILLPLTIMLSVIYLGEHYVVDVLAGIIYALAVIFFVEKFLFKEFKKDLNVADKKEFV